MYIQRIQLENVGPIEQLDYAFLYAEDGNPKPVVVVGQNGSGKSILLSFIVNTLISGKQIFYEDCEVEKGKVYKIRSQDYIKTNRDYYFSKVEFESDFECFEWQLKGSRKRYEEHFGHTPIRKEWDKIPLNESSVIKNNFGKMGLNFEPSEELKNLINHNCVLYFPPNRFEEPAWLNYDNLLARAEFS